MQYFFIPFPFSLHVLLPVLSSLCLSSLYLLVFQTLTYSLLQALSFPLSVFLPVTSRISMFPSLSLISQLLISHVLCPNEASPDSMCFLFTINIHSSLLSLVIKCINNVQLFTVHNPRSSFKAGSCILIAQDQPRPRFSQGHASFLKKGLYFVSFSFVWSLSASRSISHSGLPVCSSLQLLLQVSLHVITGHYCHYMSLAVSVSGYIPVFE